MTEGEFAAEYHERLVASLARLLEMVDKKMPGSKAKPVKEARALVKEIVSAYGRPGV